MRVIVDDVHVESVRDHVKDLGVGGLYFQWCHFDIVWSRVMAEFATCIFY